MDIQKNIASNLEKILKSISALNINPDSIKIVAATKTMPPDVINSILSLGITTMGENRVQEFLSKHDSITPLLERHFIGQLQSNKVKYIIDKVSLIQSLDRHSLAAAIDFEAKKIGKVMDVLIEVNIADETAKGGISKDDLFKFYDGLKTYKNIRVRGLMTVLPQGKEQIIEKYCLQTVKLYDKLKSVSGIDILSMGMSDDYLLAVKYGANMIRLGRVLFGERTV